jgi:hypothetical protein
MTHQEFNSLMRLIEMKAESAVRESRGMDTTQLDEDIDELTSVLRAHIVSEEE